MKNTEQRKAAYTTVQWFQSNVKHQYITHRIINHDKEYIQSCLSLTGLKLTIPVKDAIKA